MQWGFTGRSLLINARAETCEIRPTFRDSFRTRRALVPATAFFEWQPKDPARPEGSRVKLKLWRREELVFYMAALYRPLPADKNPFDLTGQFVILTSRSNRSLAAIHDRMPLIVPRPLLRAYLQDEAVARTLLGEDVAADFIAEPAGPAGTP
jgi:putative SOS response-associated peptidase YedK